MPIRDDVLVIGGGLAGVIVALSAARTGGRVRLVSAAESTLRHASGLIDVLGYRRDDDGPVVDPFEALVELPADHPYQRVGIDAIRDGLSLFDDVVTGYHGDHTDRNALVPTHGGTVKPTARYPQHTAAGLASDPRDALLVGFESLTDFDASLAADHLDNAGVPFEVVGVTVEFPADLRDDAKVTRYARTLDRDEPIDGNGVEARTALVEAVKPHLDGAERVGFPAVLGMDHPEAVCQTLEAELGIDVFEIPMGPPSLPGLRLADQLYDALDAAGVRVTTGDPIVDFEAEAGSIRSVHADRNGARIPYHADQFVLATGGLVGKGIDSDRRSVREPVFDCHVPHPEDRYGWFADDAFGAHPFARFGVEIDRELHPLDRRGDPEYDNLRAAGGVIGGADFAAEKSGSGISLATGTVAGAMAGDHA